MTDAVAGLPFAKAFKSDLFPIDRLDPESDVAEFLNKILVTSYEEEVFEPGPGGSFSMGLTFAEEAVVSLVGLDGFSLVFGGPSSTLLTFGLSMRPSELEVKLGAGARLRFPPSLLKPVRQEDGKWVTDPTRPYAEIEIAAGVIVDQDWNVDFDGENAFKLKPAMIADSGLVVEGEVALDLSETRSLPESEALGLPPTWKGVVFKSLQVHLPESISEVVPVSSLELTNFHIGSGGVTGTIGLNGTPGDGTIGGFPFRPTGLQIELRQNCLVEAKIEGRLTLSFFDEPLDVVVGFDLDGNFTVGVSTTSGLVTLTKPDVLSLEVEAISFALQESVFTASVSGTLKPLVGGLDWPGFKVQELSIDSEGNVRLEGGWLDLPSQYSLDFFGFQVAITRLGMGKTEDGGKWIGFSGSIKLVDGLSIGGSVDGLRFAWYDDGRPVKLTLDGVGVELEIPEALRFKGSVSYHELPGQRRFDGDITLELLMLGLRIDGKIVIGTDTNPETGRQYNFFALYIGVELPAGIPLWSTGLGLYGVAGLIAIEMAPNKGTAPNVLHPASRTDEEWFENADGSPGWYKRPTIGVTDLRSKWDPLEGGFALGGGVTIGTVADNGFTFSGSVLLVISFPGPVILLEGKANLLKERSTLGDDPLFRALAVLDFRAGNMLVGLDAKYQYGPGGEVIKIGGSAEAFFDFNDASRWHLYVGRKDPKEKRVRAEILSLFDANAYFMIDPSALQMGAWIGWDKHWDFGPLSVVLEAWIEAGVIVSWKPLLFHGELWLHGKAGLHVFGFGLDLSVDARISADAFEPFHVKGEFSVGISLPWPLPDFDVEITLEWGPTPDEPPLPLPLKEIAIEHFKSTASWPLPRASLLLPNADAGDGFLLAPPPPAPLGAAPPANAPVVPMDARPHITFGRAVHDDALVGVNPQPVLPAAAPAGWERIGDPTTNQGPMRARFAVKEVTLSKWSGGAWADVARKAADANPAGVEELFGSWAPVPQLPSGTVSPGSDPPVAQVKLWLWSKTPFDYSRHGGRAWEEWFTAAFQSYPCVPPVRERTVCCDFDRIPAGTQVPLPQPCRDHPEVLFFGTGVATVEALTTPVNGHSHALCHTGVVGLPQLTHASYAAAAPRGNAFGVVAAGEPASRMELTIAAPRKPGRRVCADFSGAGKRAVKLPLEVEGAELHVFDRKERELDSTRVIAIDKRRGVAAGNQAVVVLPCEARRVEVSLARGAGPVFVAGLDAEGAEMAVEEVSQPGLADVVLEAEGIRTVTIHSPQGETALAEVCWLCAGSVGVDAVAIDADGNWHGPFEPEGNKISIEVERLRGALLRAPDRVCLIQACVTFPPSKGEGEARTAMSERLEDSLGLWGEEGEVLEADTSYRLKLVTKVAAVGEEALAGVSHEYDVTELAYFRTEGPPGLAALSTPVRHPPGESFDSGLDDLSRYVRQTVPPTVPARGEQQPLPRPVYRAYDVGVLFNEDYVELLYRLAGRDLLVYLFDSNNQPVRDAEGRLIVSGNRWGVAESLVLSESEVRHLAVVDRSTCVELDPTIIPRQSTLFSADPGQVLEPDLVHEARLMPMLMHEDFRDGIGAWTVVAAGTSEGPPVWQALGHPTLSGGGATAAGTAVTLSGAGSLAALDPATDVVVLATDRGRASKTYRVLAVDDAAKRLTVDGEPSLFGGSSGWTVPGWGAVRQKSNVWGGAADASDPALPGTMLVGGNSAWTDLRLGVQLRSSDDDAIGVVFRYRDAANHYRFSMDRERSYRRLVRIAGGAATVLAEDHFVYSTNQDYAIAVEAVGDRLRVYQDGTPVFEATDATFATGRVGLYCWANEGARFADVRVDDLSTAAVVPYRFSFTTSRFSNFYHHLHSFQDETWSGAGTGASLGTELGAAVAPASAPGSAEAAAFASLAEKVLGAAAQKPVAAVEAHLVEPEGAAVALLVRSPEPIDWSRTALEVKRAAPPASSSSPPGAVKLTELDRGGSTANEEAVTLLVRERTSLAGGSIEALGIPGPLRDGDGAGRDLGSWTVLDQGTEEGPSAWTIVGDELAQAGNVWGGSDDAAEVPKPGTMALAGNPGWTDYLLSARLSSADDDAIGVVFRYRDADNYYRFSMDRGRSYRRLVKCVGGVFTTLWEDSVPYESGRAYDLVVAAIGGRLSAWLDGVPFWEVEDGDISSGGIGMYCWASEGARFSRVRVDDPERLRINRGVDDDFEWDSEGWTYATAGDQETPADWEITGGELRQSSNVWGGSVEGSELGKPGTMALSGDSSWTDYRVSARLRSDDDDAIGLVARYADADNYYRFSMDSQRTYRRLVKCVEGTVTELWSDTTPYVVGREYMVSLDLVGDSIVAHVDGVRLFSVRDPDLTAGAAGLYCWANEGARFASFRVVPAAWSTHHRFGAGEPLLAAGTRVLLHSGAEDDWTAPPTPGLTHRFLSSSDPGRRRFSSGGTVALRYREPDGSLGHERGFLPDAAYAAVPSPKILRRADGLEFAIAATAAKPLERGEYRLRLTYRRDNTAADPASLVLSQAGDSSDEVATLRIPCD